MRSLATLDTSVQTRRGAVLLIVITLLTLFAVVGLSFVFYAESEATASKLFSESTSSYRPDVDPEAALAYFLGKWIYGEKDDESGVYSALRGHDLVRSMYGANYDIMALPGTPGTPVGTVVLNGNRAAFVGTGRLHYLHDPANVPPVLANQDDYTLISYQYFLADGFLRDPERLFARTGPGMPRGAYAGGFNAPYTYPDLNSLFLAAVQANGTVLTPSFHREYLFGRLDQPPAASPTINNNQNWVNSIGKYLTLRPRPIDQLTQAQVAAAGLPWPFVWESLSLPQKQGVIDLIGSLQSQNALFPYPTDRFGDVQNRPAGPGGNESGWVDIGAPVITAPDGRKYKMMVAPLISDLDGRVNLNVHGNLKGSNQGWGRWEVSLAPIFTAAPAEMPGLFTGTTNPNVIGRYGANGVPNSTAQAAPRGPWYAPVDWDANSTAPPLPFIPPTTGNNVYAFPTYPAGYNNANAAESLNHPAKYNLFAPSALDRAFPLSNLEGLLRYGEKGSPALTPELFSMLPGNFSQPRTRNLVTLRSFDVASAGVTPWLQDRLNLDPSAPSYIMTSAAVNAVPTGPASSFPPVNPPAPTPRWSPPASAPGSLVPRSEFDTDWRAKASMTNPVADLLTRFDLNRLYQTAQGAGYLTDYPLPDATGKIVNTAGFDAAERERQKLAKDIYQLLIRVTGARDPNDLTDTEPTLRNPTSPLFLTARWLAQLAVNIVDYMDNDDYSTPFVWYPINPTITPIDPRTNLPNPYYAANFAPALNRVVFGTELPRLVLNEAYVQIDNDPNDPGLANSVLPANRQAGYYKMNVWVELHNPFKVTPAADKYPGDVGQAFLHRKFAGVDQVIYQVLVTRPLLTPAQAAYPPAGLVLGKVASWATDVPADLPKRVVLPANGRYRAPAPQVNQGFYVLGPVTTSDPGLPNTFLSPNMSCRVTTQDALRPTILLRRLACPHLPANDPNEPGFDPASRVNPYITVDYLTNVQSNNALQYNPMPRAANQIPPVTRRFAMGRTQPYGAALLVSQNPLAQAANQPKHTFFRHNGRENVGPPQSSTAGQTLTIPFDWLVHLDRPLISPLELLHVSAYPPEGLTQQFITGAGKWQHYAPWFQDNTRLYRFFEFVRTHELAAGPSLSSRLPGAININTIWDQEVLQAAAGNDPQAIAAFSLLTNANPAVNSRTQNGQIGATDAYLRGGTNHPFRSLATGVTGATVTNKTGGQYPVDTGITNTILRPLQPGAAVGGVGGATSLRLFDTSTNDHPYKRYQMLTKMFNNITTRSNVFAVWLTVGFFEVTDDTTRPVKLGAEIGRAQNRHVRHRMFAIVDRSDMRMFTVPVGTATIASTAGTKVTVRPTAVRVGGVPLPPLQRVTVTGAQYTIQKGDTVVIGVNGTSEETVVVDDVGPAGPTPTEFYVTLYQTHTATTSLVFRGNPGPWPSAAAATAASYNPRRDRTVVPYFSIID